MGIYVSIPVARGKVQNLWLQIIMKITLALTWVREHIVSHSELLANFSRQGVASSEPGSLGHGDALQQESREQSGCGK
jgi:hypothetical protein